MSSKNPEARKAASKKWKAANREKVNAAHRAWKAANKEKVKASNHRYNIKNREKKVAYQRKWRAANPEKDAAARRRQDERRLMAGTGKRGLPKPTRPRPLLCECCGRMSVGRALALDHNHHTGLFRGWLCSNCNTGLGKLGDTIDGLERGIAYLKKVEQNVERTSSLGR